MEQQGKQYLGRWEELKYLLAPYIATSAEEQRLFYELFEQFRQECEVIAEKWNTEPPEIEKPEQTSWYWLISIIAVIALITGLLFMPKQTETSRVPVQIQGNDPLFREGQNLFLQNETLLLNPEDTSHFKWEVRDAESGRLEHEVNTASLRWPVVGAGRDRLVILRATDSLRFKPMADTFRIQVVCAEPPPMDGMQRTPGGSVLLQNQEYTFALPKQEGMAVEWIFAGKDTVREFNTTYTFDALGQDAEYQVRLYHEDAYRGCYSVFSERLPLRSDKPFLPLEQLQLDEARLLLKVSPWYWLLTTLCFFGALTIFWRWWDRSRKLNKQKTVAQLEADYPVHDQAPYTIPYLPQEDKIRVPQAFFRIADVLRRREADMRRVFDADRTVEATAHAGGFPTWQDRSLTRPAEYLILLQQRDEQHQQDRLFKRLAIFLEQRDAPVTVFYHRGDFLQVWNIQHPEGLSVAQLHQQYPNHRLVLLGDGHGLVNPYSSQAPCLLDAPLHDLLRWPRRLLLTPEPVSAWSFQEALLYKHFRLFPADTLGLLSGVEAVDLDEDYLPSAFDYWQNELLPKHPEPNHRYIDWDSWEAHQSYLADDPKLFRWLCGLAVCAQPDWALTIAIGREMGVEVTHDRLLRLSRIPWLASNSPDNSLRLDLLRQLTQEDEALARQAVASELEAVSEQVKGGFAEAEWVANHAVQYFALDPKNSDHKQSIKDLKQLGLLSGDQLEELEFTVQERLDKKDLPSGATASLEAWLAVKKEEPIPAWEVVLVFLLTGLSIFALCVGGIINQQNWEGETSNFLLRNEPFMDEAMQLHNQAVEQAQQFLGYQSYQEWIAHQETALQTDSMFSRAIQMRRNLLLLANEGYFPIFEHYENSSPEYYSAKKNVTSDYQLAKRNRVAFVYNQVAQIFNFYHADSISWQVISSHNLATSIEHLPDEIPNGNKELKLNIFHAFGLGNYYEALLGDSTDNIEARILYDSIIILDSTYFERIQNEMPVNLETLLGLDVFRIGNWTGRIVDSLTNQPIARINVTGIPVSRNDLAEAFGDSSISLRDTTNNEGFFKWPEPKKPIWISGAVEVPGYETFPFSFSYNKGGIIMRLQPKPNSISPPNTSISDVPVPLTRATILNNGVAKQNLQIQLGDGSISYSNVTLVVNKRTGATQNEIFRKTYNNTNNITWDCRLDDGTKIEDNATYSVSILQDASPITVMPPQFIKQPYEPEFIRPQMVFIPGGTFTMGCLNAERDGECKNDEKPAHDVTISSFYLSKYEVTNAEFVRFLNAEGNQEENEERWYLIDEKEARIKQKDNLFTVDKDFEQHPVNCVSWQGAVAYTVWLSKLTGQSYRLPSEAEWEFAARGGSKGLKDNFLHSGSNTLDSVGWYSENSNSPHPIGLKKSNQLGLYDMSGNLWEWCADIWHKNYEGAPIDGRAWVTNTDETAHVVRGSAWDRASDESRISSRDNGGFSEDDYSDVGFRLARN